LTAHEAADKEELQVPWEWVAQVQNGSVVGYMGVKQLPAMVDKLIAAGMKPDTPAALIERGTTGAQKTVSGTLQELPQLALKENILPPAIFVIGEVVSLQAELEWFGEGVLSGKRVMVTRPADQAEEMNALLRIHGAEILPLPTIATSAYEDKPRWSELKIAFSRDKKESWERRNDWLIFTSENGVRYFIRQLFDQGYDCRSLGAFKIAAVGSGTSRELSKHGFYADFIPSNATTASLAAELSEHISGDASRVIRIRGNLGDDRVERALETAGANVLPLQVYTTFTPQWDAGMRSLLEENPPAVITFSSGSTVSGFIEILGAEGARELASEAVVASIGPMTSQIAAAEGIEVTVEAETHSIPGLVEAVVEHFKAANNQLAANNL